MADILFYLLFPFTFYPLFLSTFNVLDLYTLQLSDNRHRQLFELLTLLFRKMYDFIHFYSLPLPRSTFHQRGEDRPILRLLGIPLCCVAFEWIGMTRARLSTAIERRSATGGACPQKNSPKKFPRMLTKSPLRYYGRQRRTHKPSLVVIE